MLNIREVSQFPLRPLGDVVEVLDRLRRPINQSERDKRQGPYPYYGANGQVGTIDEFIFDEELVLVAEDGGYFDDPDKPISYRISGKSWVNNHAHVLRPKPGIDVDWLNFSLAFQDISNLVKGATRAKLNQKELVAIQVPVPPLDEQRRIVGRIKELMERVDEIRALREDAIKEAEAVEPAVFADFVENLRSEGVGVAEVKLGDILVRAQYGTSQKANQNGDGIPVLRMGNIVDWHLDVTDLKTVELAAKERSRLLLNEGDILFNRTNSFELVGKSAVFTGLDGDWTFASYLVRLEVDNKRAIPAYVNSVINSRIGREFIRSNANRAIGMVNINAQQIRELRFPLPAVAVQQRLVDRMAVAKTSGDKLREDLALDGIVTLPQAILRKAFAGEL